jgi:hypothetical protein
MWNGEGRRRRKRQSRNGRPNLSGDGFFDIGEIYTPTWFWEGFLGPFDRESRRNDLSPERFQELDAKRCGKNISKMTSFV